MVNRIARSPGEIERFDELGRVASDFANPPIDTGADMRALAEMFTGLSSTLGKLADRAAQREGHEAGVAAGRGAVGMPERVLPDGDTPASTAQARDDRAGPYNAGAGAAAPKGGRQPRGIRNNNPGNIEYGDYAKSKGATGSDGRFAKFDTPAAGVAAMHDLLAVYQSRHGLRTVEQMIGRWAPAGENDSKAYAQRVAASMGIAPDAPFDFAGSPELARRMVGAMIEVENGYQPYAAADLGRNPNIVPAASAVETQQVKPLALRRDGSIYGEAFDKAAMETAGWRLDASLSAGLTDAYLNHRDDPKAYREATDAVAKTYLETAERLGGSDLLAAAEQTLATRMAAFDADVTARYQQRAEADRQSAALTSIQGQNSVLEKQAYAIGAGADGDARLGLLTGRALSSIDQAEASGAISAAEASKQRQVAVKSLVEARVQGVFDALPSPEEKIRFAAGLKDEWVQDGPLGQLPLDDLKALQGKLDYQARRYSEEFEAANAVDREKFGRLIADDVASIAATGVGVKVGGIALDAGEITRVLGKDKARQWIEQRTAAGDIFRATDGMARLSTDRIEARLKGLEPAPGSEGFAAKAKIYDATVKVANGILQERREDPAAAVDRAVPAVKTALDQAGVEGGQLRLIEARMDAQASLGIPELARAPLTNAEAARLAQPLLLYENDPQALNEAMQRIMGDIQATYGNYADEVTAQMLRVKGIDRETSLIGASIMRKLGIGTLPQADARQLTGAQERDAASKAMAGEKVVKPSPAPAGAPNRMEAYKAATAKPKRTVPNIAQVELLRRQPDLAADFDRKFGDGQAELYLRGPQDAPARRRLSDGSTELVYPDGVIETLRPDGSIEVAFPKGAKPQ